MTGDGDALVLSKFRRLAWLTRWSRWPSSKKGPRSGGGAETRDFDTGLSPHRAIAEQYRYLETADVMQNGLGAEREGYDAFVLSAGLGVPIFSTAFVRFVEIEHIGDQPLLVHPDGRYPQAGKRRILLSTRRWSASNRRADQQALEDRRTGICRAERASI